VEEARKLIVPGMARQNWEGRLDVKFQEVVHSI
jgi:hypothetical protein